MIRGRASTMVRPIRARTAPRNRSRQRSEQGKPTAGSSHSRGALAIRSSSRRLSGGRYFRATWQTRRNKKETGQHLCVLSRPVRIHRLNFAGTVPPAPRIETSKNHGANLIKVWGRSAQLAAQNEKSRECRIRATAIFENGRLPQRDSEGCLR